MFELVVTEPFGDYAKGARITDPDVIEQVLGSQPHHVVKVAAQPKPDPAPAPKGKGAPPADPPSAD